MLLTPPHPRSAHSPWVLGTPLAAALPWPLGFCSSLCKQVLNVPSGRLAPRNFSFSDIYALNRRPNIAGSCLLSLHGIISSFQELHSVSESASLSLVSSKLPVTLEEMPRITSASQQCITRETEAQTHEFMENSGDLIYKTPVIAGILLQGDKKTIVASNYLLSTPVMEECFHVAWVPWDGGHY